MNTSATHWEQERQCVKARSTHTHPHNHTYTLEISKASTVDGEQKPYGQKTIIRKKNHTQKKRRGSPMPVSKRSDFFFLIKKKWGRGIPVLWSSEANVCLKIYQVSFAYLLGLFCLYTRSLLPIYQVSLSCILGLFCLYNTQLDSAHTYMCVSRSLLPLYQVSFAYIIRSLIARIRTCV